MEIPKPDVIRMEYKGITYAWLRNQIGLIQYVEITWIIEPEPEDISEVTHG